MEGHERLLTVLEVARLCRVDPKTVRRWIYAGKLTSHPTPGGHHRVWESDVRALTTSPGRLRNGPDPAT